MILVRVKSPGSLAEVNAVSLPPTCGFMPEGDFFAFWQLTLSVIDTHGLVKNASFFLSDLCLLPDAKIFVCNLLVLPSF